MIDQDKVMEIFLMAYSDEGLSDEGLYVEYCEGDGDVVAFKHGEECWRAPLAELTFKYVTECLDLDIEDLHRVLGEYVDAGGVDL